MEGEGGGGPETPHTDKLYIFPWQVYPDMMVFDWFIRLADKDRSEVVVVMEGGGGGNGGGDVVDVM